MTRRTALALVRASAVYDLVVTIGFALPVTAPLVFGALTQLHLALGVSGTPPTADPYTVLFANLTGSVVTVWAPFRIVRPSLLAGAADALARLLFSTALAAALLAGASQLTVLFLAPELAWALVQGAAVLSQRSRAREVRPALG